MPKTFTQEIEYRLADQDWDSRISESVIKTRKRRIRNKLSTVIVSLFIVTFTFFITQPPAFDASAAIENEVTDTYAAVFDSLSIDVNFDSSFIMNFDNDIVTIEWE
ncbi:hypothetical protein ACFLZV_06090 [Candidatus Margulisiibacteriota bacterium]